MPMPWSSSTRPAGTAPRPCCVPDNITLLPLPPYSPELNPVENLWQFLKHNFLNARVFAELRGDRRRLLRRLEPPPRHPRPDPLHHHPRLGQNGQYLGRLVLVVVSPSLAQGSTTA